MIVFTRTIPGDIADTRRHLEAGMRALCVVEALGVYTPFNHRYAWGNAPPLNVFRMTTEDRRRYNEIVASRLVTLCISRRKSCD